MYPTNFEIGLAIILVAGNVGIYLWFRRSELAGSARRMGKMMLRFGLSPAIANRHDPATKAVMSTVRKRCRACRVEGHCERWLCDEVKGGSGFCPNATSFALLSAPGANNPYSGQHI